MHYECALRWQGSSIVLRMALDPAPLLTKHHATIVLGLSGAISAHEHAVREQALRHVEEAQRRHLTIAPDDRSNND